MTVHQVQALEGRGEPFDFLLPLRWKGADGAVRKELFRVREAVKTLRLEGAPVAEPEVDPDVELLFRPA